MITYDNPYTATAHINSLDGATDEITILGEDKKGNNDKSRESLRILSFFCVMLKIWWNN